MWSSAALYMCIFFGIIHDVYQVGSESKFIQRKSYQTPNEVTKQQEDLQKIIDQIHLLSSGNTRSFSIPSTEENLNLSTYDEILSELSALNSPLRERFMEDFPKMLVCILSGRQDCGLEAELIKTASLEFGPPLLSFLSSLRSQTCTSETNNDALRGIFGTYATEGTTIPDLSQFQQILLKILSSLSVSERLKSIMNALLNATARYVLQFMAIVVEVPLDYIRIALQFGIEIPSFDKKQTCSQGDLKQLIMWGMKNNVSWSFSAPFLEILLENIFPLEQSTYAYPGSKCQDPSSVQFQRTSDQTNDTEINYEIMCDQSNLTSLNETLCADILSGAGDGSSASTLTLCQVLSNFSRNQVELTWRNMCYFLQALVSPFSTRSSVCSAEESAPFDVVTSLHEFLPLPLPPASRRAARGASSLRQLVCDYNSWLANTTVDAGLVSLCSDNDHAEFVRQVCNNATLMKKLLSYPMNSWLYGYCGNSSADVGYLVSQLCVYEQWLNQPTGPINTVLINFCMSYDKARLTQLMCEHTGFLMIIMSNPDNGRFMPNCTNLPPPPPIPGLDPLPVDSCQYSEWNDLSQITTDVLSKCIMFDQSGFTKEVCLNKTFLNSLLQNKENNWLEMHCSTSFIPSTPEPSPVFNFANWCDYQTWGQKHVDNSIVALCWQNDQQSFNDNVCCQRSVLDELLKDPQNTWLSSACSDMSEITLTPQVCTYSEWTRPVIVDMTDVTLCSETDPDNFTSKVCNNETVLQNLLANQDNAWLIEYCGNHSNLAITPVPGVGQGTGGTPFNAAEQCQYSSWSVSPPHAALLTQCWEHDLANFVSSICSNAAVLLSLSWEPSSVWVKNMCQTFTNYTTTPKNSTTTDKTVCIAKELINEFNLICPSFYISDCQPCTTQNVVLQMMVRCLMASLSFSDMELMTVSVAKILDEAISTAIVVMLTLEDTLGTTLHVSDAIRPSLLRSVVDFFKNESDPDKKTVLLQCFGTLLSSLLHSTRDVTSDEMFLIKEYFLVPVSKLKPVLAAANISTVRLILQYYYGTKNMLNLPDGYLSTMVSVLLQTHLVKDETLLPELTPLLAAASPADIQALPPLQSNFSVRESINKILNSMSLEQREAFGLWYSKGMSPTNIIKGQRSLIQDSGNLIAYLPFPSFQHLSAAQLLDGLDVLQRNTLTLVKREFIANTVIGTYKNLTAQDFIRLGNISCMAEPADILVYNNTEAFRVIQDTIMNCALKGISMPSQLISIILRNSPELQAPSSITSGRLTEIAPLLPMVGGAFLQRLTASQLLPALPALSATPFTAAQASIIMEKLFPILTQYQLQELGSLAVGVKTETLMTLTSDQLRLFLKAFGQTTKALDLCSHQANAITTKLWGFTEVVGWLNDVEPLLNCTPLISVLRRIRPLLNILPNTITKKWNTQQAQAIFTTRFNTNPNEVKQNFLDLGTLGQGLTCKILQDNFQANPIPSSVKKVLAFLRQQPNLLHTSLKKCLIEAVSQFEFFSELLVDLGVEMALSMPVSTIKKFGADEMDTLRKMIIQEPHQFLMLSKTKQELLVDKIAQRLGMYTADFTEEEFQSLGIMAPFVVDEIFIQVDRSFFIKHLDALKEFCYSGSKMEIVARILQEPAVFGPVQKWNKTTITQVGRFVFFLPNNVLETISPDLMTVGRIEKLFMSQRRWAQGNVGILCSDQNDMKAIFDKQQFVLQFFLGFLKMTPSSSTPLVPTCEMLHTTAPSVWTSSSLSSMSSSAFSNCLELMGSDSYLAFFQRGEVLKRVKKMYGPVSSLSPSVIAQLGVIATELTPEELNVLQLTEKRSIAAMGAVKSWTSRQLAALFTAVLNSTKQSPNQLDSSTLVALGHIICGAKTTEIKLLNNVEFSRAVLCLGRLSLSCSEEQLQALVELLSHSLAFGLMSSWGTDVFMEIGVLAAGLPDIAMSALVQEQIEGITPMAISMISPQKFSVSLNQKQISMFSYEQAAAVTQQQISALSDVQRTALDMVLTPWVNRPVDFRGRSRGLVPSVHPLCLIFGLLMQLTVLSPLSCFRTLI